MRKRIVTAALSVVFLFCSFASLCACGARETAIFFGVLAFGGSGSTRVDLWRSDAENRYYLFLPSDADPRSLTVVCGKKSVSVNGERLTDGQTTDVFSRGGEVTLRVGGRTVPVKVLQSKHLPAVFIETASGTLDRIHADKRYKEAAGFTLAENGRVTVDDAPLKHIKGRGNDSWLAAKKPYNIKFEQKRDILGMGAAKKWVLLADSDPLDSITEPALFELARGMRFAFTPEYRHIDLYINGEYKGLYRICEPAQVHPERLDIYDIDKATEQANPDADLSLAVPKEGDAAGNAAAADFFLGPGERRWFDIENDPADVSGGYLIELDTDLKVSAFCSDRGQTVSIRAPEYATKAEAAHIADLYQRAEDAIYAPDGTNADGSSYAELFDLDTLVDLYILQEFSRNCVADGSGSTFFHQPTGEEKLFAGPVWDFSDAFEEIPVFFGMPVSGPEDWWANALPWLTQARDEAGADSYSAIPSLLTAAYRHEDFRAAVAERWKALTPALDGMIPNIRTLWTKLSAANEMNALRWAEELPTDPRSPQVYLLRRFTALLDTLTRRRKAMDKGFSPDAAMLYYDANGGEGVMFHTQILSVGETATLNGAAPRAGTQTELISSVFNGTAPFVNVECLISPPKGYTFTGWNTAPDGSGDTYQPGDGFVLAEKTNVLYAQWKKK
ncbi:MAG: CotH kinase family protein [Clostridia bacterium]|nr:CotH kinase family protein [Clostridia bacterium]